jgi:hypothetical protein
VPPLIPTAAPVVQQTVPAAAPAANFAAELPLSVRMNQRSDQFVQAKLVTISGPTLPKNEIGVPESRRQPFDTIASPVGAPLFSSIAHSSAQSGTLYVVTFGIPKGPEKYVYNCRSGLCQGSAADVWVAMPPLQRQQYLSSLLDVYEPIAQAFNSSAVTPFAAGVVQQPHPIQHAELLIQPTAARTTVLAAAKVDIDPAGSIKRLYAGPHFTADLEPSSNNGRPFLGAQWIEYVAQ